MKQCLRCFEMFDSNVAHRIYCSDACRNAATKEKQSAANKIKPKRRKKCASSKCNNLVSIYSDSIYCSRCYLSDSTIEKDLKRIRRMAGA